MVIVPNLGKPEQQVEMWVKMRAKDPGLIHISRLKPAVILHRSDFQPHYEDGHLDVPIQDRLQSAAADFFH